MPATYTFRINDGTDSPIYAERACKDDAHALRKAPQWIGDSERTVTVFRGTERMACAGNARFVAEVKE